MKKIGNRTYRGITLIPVLGGWNHATLKVSATGESYKVWHFTRSLEKAKHSIRFDITSGGYAAIDGALVQL